MTSLTNLTATATESPSQQVHTGLALHDQPSPGFFRGIRMGLDGILFHRGDAQVLIPLSELWKLAETVAPSLAPAAVAPLAPSQTRGPDPAIRRVNRKS